VFVLSLRASTLKIAAAVTALAIVVAAACWEGSSVRMSADVPVQGSVVKTAVQNIDASTNDGRLAFLKNYGWEVSGTPVEVVEVIIPKTFNTVYTNYNAIQKSQGFDLSKFKGERVKRWTYDVKNYPGGVQNVRANLLVYNNKVVGGDVSSVALDGFMQGLSIKVTNTKAAIKPSQADIVAETLKLDSHTNSN